ncbi:MAG: tetratricopeptide repeat protein, partial [Planctomycetales bacterium]|nr:tetratricopeptide repeat protein [Planctomycetales bacterium]
NEVRAEALGLRARLQKDRDKALRDFAQALELAPDDSSFLLSRAVYLRERQELEQALADVEIVLQDEPDAPAALLLKGELLQEAGRLDEALATFDRLSKSQPKLLEAYQHRGEIYRAQGEFKKAVKEFTMVLQLRPGVILTLLHRAEAHLLDGDNAGALADVEAALAQQPGLVAGHRLRAQALVNNERFAEAIDEMQALVKALPEDTEIRMQLALYYQFNQDLTKAIAAYTDVLELEPSNVAALRFRGDAYLSRGEHPAAIADLRRAVELSPDDSGILNNLAWVLATSPDDAVRDGTKAIELAKHACELTENKKAHILSTLAAAYAESGDFEEARRVSRQALEADDPDLNDELRAALQKELDSYLENKPWREKQLPGAKPAEDAEDAASADAPPPVEKPASQSLDF